MNDKRPETNKLSGMKFNEALQRFSKTSPVELAAVTNSSMKDVDIERLISAFESAAQFDDNKLEYWLARDLQRLLEYERWENFTTAINRAKLTCENSGQPIQDHFRDITKMIELGKSAMREIDDIRLSRYACYLITQNGDSKKKPIAFGQTYFAIQTRRQELADQASGVAVPQSEDEKLVFLRNQIKEHNKYLSSAAKNAGVVTPQEFAIFHSKGYQGLYSKTVPEIRKYKGLASSTDILDRMGSTELAANFFRVTQTEEKLRKDSIKGLKKAYETHYAVGKQVRDAMLKISGIAPEDLPIADNIKQAEKRIKFEPAAVPQQTRPLIVNQEPKPIRETVQEDRRPINLRTELWKFALLVMATRQNGYITTADLITELPTYIQVPDNSQEVLTGRKDSKFSQLVRNLKSHKLTKTNFISQGFAEDTRGGFKITEKGLEFVKSYFS